MGIYLRKMRVKKPKFKQTIPKEAKRVFKGVIFDVYQWKQKMFDGSFQIFERLRRSDTVIIVPVTSRGRIIVTEEEQPDKKPFIGVAGGRVRKGENIKKAAVRELLEETGYKADKLVFWNAIQPFGKIDWTVYTFVAKNCHKVGKPQLDAGEKISIKLVSFEEFVDLVTRKDFDDLEIVKRVIMAKKDPKEIEALQRFLIA